MRIFELVVSSFLAFKVEISCENSTNCVVLAQNISATVNFFACRWMILHPEFPTDMRISSGKSLTATYVVSGGKVFSSSGSGQSTSSGEDSQSCVKRRSQLGPSHHMTWFASSTGYKPLKAQSAGFEDPAWNVMHIPP